MAIRKHLSALVICLLTVFALGGLLPATALAAAPSGQVIYVGNVDVTSGGYWTTDNSGNVTAYSGPDTPTDNFIHYDATNNVLTLHNATIKERVPSTTSTYVVGAAIGVLNQNDASELTIKLEGTNTIAEVSAGIYVLASSNSTGDASLTITGNGSLNASGSYNPAIIVQSNGGNATLSIENAKVTATASSSGDGVLVQSKNDSSVSLTVEGGSLTATGSGNNGAGIQLLFGSSDSGSGTPSLTVNGNSIVRANGGISDNSNAEIQIGTDSSGTNGGIVFDGNEGTVYGDVTLQEDLGIGKGESLKLDDGASLSAGGHNVIADGGTVDDSIKDSLGDSVKYTPTITTTNLPNGTVGAHYYQTLAATGSDTITWSVTSGSLPAGLTLEDGVLFGTPTAEGSSTFTVKAENSYGSDSKKLSLTINEPTSISVTGVSLDQNTLTLAEDDSAQLTATVKPADATNKDVTWSSDNEAVATVDANGKVTTVRAGTTTITVTTEDGSFIDTCKVTVKHGNMILAPKKDATCTAQGKSAYYTCETCGKYFEDEAGTKEITNLAEYGIIAVISHSLAKTEAKAATCTEEGNTEYWTCETCGKIFSDAAGKTEITLTDTVIPVTNHNYKDGKCTVCGDADPNYQEPTSPTKHEPAAEDSTKNTKDSAVTKSSTPQTSDALFGYAIFFAALIVLASVVSVVAYRKLHTVQAKHSSSNKH